jgi:5-hydroxyisourate hydrolase-like protein (transthyretin family)
MLHVADYFANKGDQQDKPPFLNRIPTHLDILTLAQIIM